MGRPLNKRFFGDPALGGEQVACLAYYTGGDASVASAIVEQRSNSKYRVTEITPTNDGSFVVGFQYTIVSVGTTDFIAVGAASDTVGVVFTATGVGGAGSGTAGETEICTLTDATPAAGGEMQVIVTPENATATVQAEIAFTSAGGTGALLTVSIAVAGYGYWAPGTNVALTGTTDGTVDYTVDGNGSLATVSKNTDGSGNTQAESPVNLGDAPAANPPVSNARIINARTVKNFGPNSTTYDWPITAPLGSTTPGGRAQADIGS